MKTPTHSTSLELVIDLNVCAEASDHEEERARDGRPESSYRQGQDNKGWSSLGNGQMIPSKDSFVL